MFYQDARSQFPNGFRTDVYNPGISAPVPAFGYGYPTYAPIAGYSPAGYAPTGHAPVFIGQELAAIHARMNEIRLQIEILTNLVRQSTVNSGMTNTLAYQGEALQRDITSLAYGSGSLAHNNGNVRTRENDSHIILEVFLPHLSMGDVDVEISGNRIICRTRVPVNPAGRWWLHAQLPRGLELFELADGRVEFGWLVPVAFQAKEVEASWRDGFMCIYVPKAEAAMTKQTVQVVRDSKSRKTADLNS